MPPLGAKERAKLPDSAFAYIDSHGKRRLPIHDAAHVRNALARFSQVAFEDEGARDKARTRLLRAAKKHDIVPIGSLVGAVLLGGLGGPLIRSQDAGDTTPNWRFIGIVVAIAGILVLSMRLAGWW